MKNMYKEKLVVDDTSIDYEMRVPITEIMRMLEIATFNHADSIGLDHDNMIKTSNAFWIVSKMKLLVTGSLKSGDKATIKTWTYEPGMIRFDRACELKVGSSIKAKAIAEWCCLDYETRRIRKGNSINFPQLEMVETKKMPTTYTNMKLDVDKDDYVYTKTIRSTDIDVNNHTNNLKYNFMAIDCFTVDEMKSMDIKEYEIYFVNESHEGDKIDIYRKKYKSYYYIEGKCVDKTIFRTVIKFKKK